MAMDPEERKLRIGADEDMSSSAEIRKALLGAKKRLWNLLNLYPVLASQLRRDQVGAVSCEKNSLCRRMHR
jgi:hypothetical protein